MHPLIENKKERHCVQGEREREREEREREVIMGTRCPDRVNTCP